MNQYKPEQGCSLFWEVNHEVRNALCKIGPAAKDAIPEIIEALKLDEDNMDIVSGAADVLGSIGPVAIPSLIKTLKDKNDRARWFAAKALGEMGPAAKDAIPALIEALKREGGEGIFAADALKKIQGKKFQLNNISLDNASIRQYIDGLVYDAGVIIPENEIEAYKKKLDDSLMDCLRSKLLKALDDKEFMKLKKLFDQGEITEKGIPNFISSHIDYYEGTVEKILYDFREDYLATFKK